MLLEDKDTLDIETRTGRAFRYDRDAEKRKIGDDIFEEYVLGGIEILHDKIMYETTEIEDYLMKVHTFISDFNRRYYDLMDNESIYDMCKLSGN